MILDRGRVNAAVAPHHAGAEPAVQKRTDARVAPCHAASTMSLLICRRLAGPADAALFAIVLTPLPPGVSSSMPPVTLFVFLFAITALGIVATASAMMRRLAAPLAVGVRVPRPSGQQ